ncbi:unnamed protein product [Pylaiella littoralis]
MGVIEKSLKAVPKSDVFPTRKAELKYSMAMKAGDALCCTKIPELSTRPSGPPLPAPCRTSTRRPSCCWHVQPNALVQLANLKIMVARDMADAEVATSLIDGAVALCTTKDELLETLSVRVATEGRVKGAQVLGCTTPA